MKEIKMTRWEKHQAAKHQAKILAEGVARNIDAQLEATGKATIHLYTLPRENQAQVKWWLNHLVEEQIARRPWEVSRDIRIITKSKVEYETVNKEQQA